MRLIRPTLEMEDAYLDFAREWEEHGESITPYSARLLDQTYAQWHAMLARIEKESVQGLVPAHTFFYLDDAGRIVGALNLRHELNDYLMQCGGHIGYGVRPSERRKGHASRMLALALPHARRLGLERVLITCDRENTASARTILRNGGILENEVQEEERITQRYWIALG